MELNPPPLARRLDHASRLTLVEPPLEAATTPLTAVPSAAGLPGTAGVPGIAGVPNAAPARAASRLPAIDRMQMENVSLYYGAAEIVKSVSLPIRQGEVLALIGPSGCGKTTLLRSINRLTELTKTAHMTGTITLDGIDTQALEPTELRRRVSMVFQQPNPFPMSIFDNVAYALREQARRRPRRAVLREQVEDALDRAALLDEVKDDLSRPALRLSGGQQQRLCIARALAAKP